MIETTEKKYQELISFCEKSLKSEDIPRIQEAFDFAYQKLGDTRWDTGEVIIEHSIEVALIVAQEIGLGHDSIRAGLLHDVAYEKSERKVEKTVLEKLFGNTVADILEGMAKINSLGTDTVDLHSENYRKLMLALAGDVRVILTKIADRLQVMRQLHRQEAEIQQKITIETSHLYAPLAHRLGFYNINSEMLDLCLKYLNPEAYNYVSHRLQETAVERANFVAEFVKPIEDKLNKKGFNFDMKARTKAINSIWRKMQSQQVGFDEVYDIFAIRVILDTELENEKSECWQVYSIVTEEYQSNPKRMRDWITIPKSNGYESLHATVLGPQGKWVEIQIRTRRMDEIAEKGLAAHWKYKGGQANVEMEKWLANIREILENPDATMDFIDDFKMNVYEDEIFVFTPKGDLKKIKAGATLLDFAYEIHSTLGDRCVGGKVNGKNVTLKYKLKNGDQISIDTSNNQRPKMDWLEFVVTSKAKSRIKASLNEEVKREAEHGKEILLRKLKNWKIPYEEDTIRRLLKQYKLKLAQDLYYQISTGKIEPLAIKDFLTEKEETSARQMLSEVLPKEQLKDVTFSSGDDCLVIDENIRSITYKLSACCNPIFGDEIFGFVTIKEGIKIHRKTCPNAKQMMERYPYRIFKARWLDTGKRSSFQAVIRVSGTNDSDIVPQLSYVIAKENGIQLRSINIESEGGEFEGSIKVMVNNLEHLDFLLGKMKNIRGVLHVSRAE